MPRGGDSERISGRATREGTRRFAERFAALPEGAYRSPDDLSVSSLGLGLRRGQPGGSDDLLYRGAVDRCLEGGINLFVTALSDRIQTSERALGVALRRAFAEGTARRDEVVVVSGAGELVPEPEDMGSQYHAQRSLHETYVDTGLLRPSEVTRGRCMEPAFVLDQLERSRRNIGLDTLDFYLLQEPEVHLKRLGPEDFWEKLARVFEALEARCSDGAIGGYGIASWDGFLLPASDRHHLSLVDCFRVALEVGGGEHHLRALQLPYGIAAGEIAVLDSQLAPDGSRAALLELLPDTGTLLLASAPLYGGRLVGRVPDFVRDAFPETGSDAQCCLQFTRSTPNVSAAVVGMREPDHVAENLGVLRRPPARGEVPLGLFAAAAKAS